MTKSIQDDPYFHQPKLYLNRRFPRYIAGYVLQEQRDSSKKVRVLFELSEV
jgi:hypothetical protein